MGYAVKCDGCDGFHEVQVRGFPVGWGFLAGYGIQRALCPSCLEIANKALPVPWTKPEMSEVPGVDLPPEEEGDAS